MISGGGTTMDAMIEACQSGKIPDTEVGLIITSSAKAGGIEKAKKRGIPEKDIVVINPKNFRMHNSKEQDELIFGEAILEECRRRSINVITQNGWMKHTPDNVTSFYRGRIFNQHPGDPKNFGGPGMTGLTVHKATIRYWEMLSTVEPQIWEQAKTHVVAQYVDPQYDKGVVILYKQVPVLSTDTPEILQQRALPYEHAVQIELLQRYVGERIFGLVEYAGIVLPGTEDYARMAKDEALIPA